MGALGQNLGRVLCLLSFSGSLLACMGAGLEEGRDSSRKGTEVLDDYRGGLALLCSGEPHVVLSSVLEDEDWYSDPFETAVYANSEVGNGGVFADLVRIYATRDDTLSVELDEDNWFNDPALLVLARPANSRERYRLVSVPLSVSYHLDCSSGSCLHVEEEREADRTVDVAGPHTYFRFFEVVRGFDSEIDTSRWSPDGSSPRPVWLADGAGEGDDGLILSATPPRWEERYGDDFEANEPPEWLENEAIFVPFDQIPVLRDIADRPLDWAVVAVPRRWEGNVGDWGKSFDYDLIVRCPWPAGCSAAPMSSAGASLGNCGLPLEAALPDVEAVEDEEGVSYPWDGQWMRVPAGTIQVGSPTDEEGSNDVGTLDGVEITRSFLLYSTEVTQAEYLWTAEHFPSDREWCPDCPVEDLTWHEAALFCNRLSYRADLERCYVCSGDAGLIECTPSTDYGSANECPGYRLPTEAEWEYAARAGATGTTYAELDSVAWHRENSDRGNGMAPQAVGLLAPNDFGLYDMLGNVAEWCHDWYGPYSETVSADPWGPANGQQRVIRGGSITSFRAGMGLAERDRMEPGLGFSGVGFRPARTDF